MAVVYNIDTSSRKSNRHGGSGRRTRTSYDKYGYEITTLGSSSILNGKDTVMHVVRVQPGVVVNFIEPSYSSRNRGRSWTTPYIVEYKPSRKGSYSHVSEDSRDSSWTIPHSPHPRNLDIVDDNPLDSAAECESPTPKIHHYIPGEPFLEQPYHDPPYHDPHYHDPPPMEPLYCDPHHMEPLYPESHPMEPHYPMESREPPRHVPSPVDIPVHSRQLDHSDYSLHSPSIPDSDLTRFDQEHSSDPYYFDPRQSPVSIDIPIESTPSPRSRRPSFDFGKPPSPLNSNCRTVRFKDDPVLPSPPARRKGWWNRKGDQLWDNDGSYAAAPEHDLYPSDLRNYPEAGKGWMNEEGIQIDMKRRLVRKKPLRSALKKSSL